jgi:hypothetical protein
LGLSENLAVALRHIALLKLQSVEPHFIIITI